MRHAENALDEQDYEWAAFAALQAAEKTLKGLIVVKGGEESPLGSFGDWARGGTTKGGRGAIRYHRIGEPSG